MATTIERLDLVYCESWDTRSRAAARPLPSAAAQERERAGDPYAVLLLDHGIPTALVEMNSRCGGYTIWRFDDHLRRASRYELRRVGSGELVLAERVQWRYPDRHRPEFDHATPRHTRRFSPDGLVHDIDEPQGGTGASTHRFGRSRDCPARHRMPEFGDMAALAALAGAVSDPLPVVGCEPGDEVAMSPLVALPWQPPAPSRPARLAPMFHHGTRYQVPGRGEVAVEVGGAGRLRLPTGRLVATDVHGLAAAEPFTVRVTPGQYPVSVSWLRRVDSAQPPVVAAVRVEIRPEPASSWELALRPHRDPCSLGSWQFFGFEVATGTACLADAAARVAMAGDPRLATVPGSEVVELAGANPATNLLAFPAGQGTYPTWLGRTASGEVACYVADLMRLPDAGFVRAGS